MMLGLMFYPFLWASFHASGSVPSIIDLLNIICKGTFIALDSSFSTPGWNPSGPADLETFNLFSFFSTRSGVIIISLSVTLWCRSFIMRMVSVSFLVNTRVNYLFRVSAFSLIITSEAAILILYVTKACFIL